MKKFRTFLIGAVLTGAVWTVSGQGEPADGQHKGLTPCKPAGSGSVVLCGKLAVFENRRVKKGRMIELNVIVLPSVGKAIHPPIFDLDGGPGISDTKNVEIYTTDLKQYREGRDIVLVDQRGTGDSNPLRCNPLTRPPGNALEEMYPVDYVNNCRRELEKKADLRMYTTEIAMDDLNDVRVWLGYPKIDLVGVSYGTRAAQVFIRRHPGAVGRAVLMGAIATYHKMPFYHAPNAQRALDLLLAKCLAESACHTAFPDIESELSHVISGLRQQPKKVPYVDPKTGDTTPILIHADEFAEKIRTWLYQRSQAQAIPYVIHSAFKDNYTPFLSRAVGSAAFRSFSDGLYLSITCAEDVPFVDERKAGKLSVNTIFGNYRVFQQKRACKNWVRGNVSREFLSPVTSDVPLLIISGDLDPVTLPAWGAEIASGFKNGRQVIFPELGHIPDGVSNLDCVDRIMLSFLGGTPAERLDSSCIQTMHPDPFLIAEPSSTKDKK